jgi:WXXGXW repeat (2 copies)
VNIPRQPALVLALLLGLAGCVVAPVPVANPYPNVPAARYEAVPPRPGPPSVWVWTPGRWEWNGRAYVWFGGRYVRREPQWSHWVPGHWAFSYGAWRWLPGHWA